MNSDGMADGITVSTVAVTWASTATGRSHHYSVASAATISTTPKVARVKMIRSRGVAI